ncbi:hypothetical protein [Candidatus Lokiarchaeum ossiferum]|uniref:hypothetical protein n=1 Tax=Candidatus Lokiarchaeum ossiferum TaxID=2951803 RepID=UPI00352F50AF
MSSIPEGCDNIPVCCQCYHPQEVVGKYVDCEICGRTICLECGSSKIHPFITVCHWCAHAVSVILQRERDRIASESLKLDIKRDMT